MPQEYSIRTRWHEIEGRAIGNSQLQLEEKRVLVKSINFLEYVSSYAHFYGFQQNLMELLKINYITIA